MRVFTLCSGLLVVLLLDGWLTVAQDEAAARCVRSTDQEPQTGVFGDDVPLVSATSGTPHPCLRDCSTADGPIVCEYTLVVEWYYTMSKACYNCPCTMSDCDRPDCVAANGIPKLIMVANRTFPGPSIEVCQDDQVVLTVINHADNGEGISIHAHGIYQRGTPYMDGVSMLTQCPIGPHTKFTYNFTADHAGTHMWHGHTGMHRADGLFGPLVVRPPDKTNRQRALYDLDLPEHMVMMNDWIHRPAAQVFADHHHARGEDNPDSILINGKGQFAVYMDSTSLESPAPSYVTPREVFEVEQGRRYRFRLVSSGITNTPMKVSVDGHNLTLISTDGSDVEPRTVDALFLFGGERYDVVLDASQDVGNYWLKVKGYGQARGVIQGYAIVRYKGAPIANPTPDPTVDRTGVVFQEWNAPPSDTAITVNQLVALENASIPQKGKRTVYVSYDLNPVNNVHFNKPDLYPLGPTGPGYGEYHSAQINRRSFHFLDIPPLSQFDEQTMLDELCEVDSVDRERCSREYCSCPQYIQVELGQTLEIVLVDESKDLDIVHPFHLHGHAFRVVAQAKLGTNTSLEAVKMMDQNGEIKRNFNSPPEKDTVMTPSAGYTVIQFVADNPGWWFLHCHLEFHVEVGMGLVVRVGNQTDLPPVPKDFPRCGNYYGPSSSSAQSLIVIVLSVVIAVLLIIVIVLVVIVQRSNKSNGRGKASRVPNSDPQSATKL
ncbi:uncharacterized protein [Diadema antillarum]|uniref:uncharacterized protein n=1 Tax=Diadema antillarum TaxID=105358 RepID=UPI003A88D8C5